MRKILGEVDANRCILHMPCDLPNQKLIALISFAFIFSTFKSQVLPGAAVRTNGCGYFCDEAV